jgi:hypothetical protein
MRRERITLRLIAATVVQDALNLERGFPSTLVALALRPGEAIRDYLSGRTLPYTNPFKYLLVWVALSTLFTAWFDLLSRGFVDAFPDPDAPGAATSYLVMEVLAPFYNLALLFGVPFMALFSRMLFRRAGYNLAEHMVFNGFVYGQQTALFVLLVPVMLLWPGATAWVMVLYLLMMMAYYAWACVSFFQVGWVRGTFLALSTSFLATGTYYLALVAVVGLVVRFTG